MNKKTKIIESFYDNINNLPKDYILVSISVDISEEIKNKINIWERRLAPSWSIYKEYNETNDKEKYTKRFYEERLSKIDLDEIIRGWEYQYGCGKTFVLLCYEKPDEFCHRHIVLEEINKN